MGSFENITTLVTDLGPVLLAFVGLVVPIITLSIYFGIGDFVTGLLDGILKRTGRQ